MTASVPPAPPTPPAAPTPGPTEGVAFCTLADFQKVQLRVAEIVAAENHPNADKLLKIQVRVGDRTKQVCAGIKAWYAPEQLVGKRAILVDNLEPRKLRGEMSEGMLLAAHEPGTGRLCLLTTDLPDFASGSTIS